MDYSILTTKPYGLNTIEAWTNLYVSVDDCNVHKAFVKPVLEFVDQADVKRVIADIFKGITNNELTITCDDYRYRHLNERKPIWINVEYLNDKLVNGLEYTLEEKAKKVMDYQLVIRSVNLQSFAPRVLVGLECRIDEVFSLESELAYRNKA